MSSKKRTEWLATYHEGDSRIRNKRHGLVQLNRNKQQIEFAVQTAETSPIIIVSYPIRYLKNINIREKGRMKKHRFLELTLGEPPNEMNPIFSFSIEDVEVVKEEILKFQEEVMTSELERGKEKQDTEDDILSTFSRLLKIPIEQFHQLFEEVSSRLRIITAPSKLATKAILSSVEPKFPYKIQEVKLNGRNFRFFCTSHTHSTVLLLLSPIGGRIEDYYPMISSLLGKYQIFIMGCRGYDGLVEQDQSFKLEDYIQDLKAFLGFIDSGKEITIVAHSVFSAILLEEFLNQKYSNIKKFVLISGLHRAPDNFRKGVKALPPTQMWSPFKGQVRKIAPKLLFKKDSNSDLINSFVDSAFNVPDKVYYEILTDFLPKYDYVKNLKLLEKPLLVIWGRNDQLIPMNLKNDMINVVRPSLLTYKELPGGHMLILEEPTKVGREINKFVTSDWRQIKVE